MSTVNKQECNHKFFFLRQATVQGKGIDVFCCEKCLEYKFGGRYISPITNMPSVPSADECTPYTAGERRLLLFAAALVVVLGIIRYGWPL